MCSFFIHINNMPIIKSAKKALRQSLKRKVRNNAYTQKIKKLLKEAKSLASRQKTEDAMKMLPAIYKALDKAAKTGVIKKNTASRKKSRLALLLNKPSAKTGK